MTQQTSATTFPAGRTTTFSESLWEPQMGYSRGVRVQNHVFVAGTVASDGAGRAQGDDAYEQTLFVLAKIERALAELGAGLSDVVSTVTHLSDFAHFDDYARAHHEYFGDIRPVNTTVRAELVRPAFLVEVSATAVLPAER